MVYGVPGITATASGLFQALQLYDKKYLTEEPIVIRLVGEQLGTGLIVPTNTIMKFPGDIGKNISISVLIPSSDMLTAADKLLRRSFWGRRSDKTFVQMKMLSRVIHVYPIDTSVFPGSNLSVRVDLNGVTDRNTTFVYRWDEATNTWKKGYERLTFGTNQVWFTTQNFSIFSVIGPVNATGEVKDDVIPQQLIAIILATLGIFTALVVLLIFLLKRRQRQHKLQAAKLGQNSPQVLIMHSPKREEPFLLTFPPTPAETPRTPRTPRGSFSSPLTPYRAMGETEQTMSWKRHLFSRASRVVESPRGSRFEMSPVPKLLVRDIDRLKSPDTNVPELSMPKTPRSEWGLSSARRLLTGYKTPRNAFSSRSHNSSREPTPTRRRDLEGNLDLLSISFAPQLRVSDVARNEIHKDSLPPSRPPPTRETLPPSRPPPMPDDWYRSPMTQVPQLVRNSQENNQDRSMGFAKLVRSSKKAHAVLSPITTSQASHLPEPKTPRSVLANSKQEPLDTIMVMADDYGDQSGIGRGRKQVRYVMPPAHSPRRSGSPILTHVAANARRFSSDAATAASPRNIESRGHMLKQLRSADRRQSGERGDSIGSQRESIGQSLKFSPDSNLMKDDHSPSRHQGPRIKTQEYVHSPPFGTLLEAYGRPHIEVPSLSRPHISASLGNTRPGPYVQPGVKGVTEVAHNYKLGSPLVLPIAMEAHESVLYAENLSNSDSPARAWNQRDHTAQRSQTRSVQQPTAPSNLVWRGGDSRARQDYEEQDTRDYQDSGRDWASPSSPEFSIR
jgi:hypothetical protein